MGNRCPNARQAVPDAAAAHSRRFPLVVASGIEVRSDVAIISLLQGGVARRWGLRVVTAREAVVAGDTSPAAGVAW